MSEVPLHTTCGGASFVPWKSPEPAARTCREQVGVGGTCIFESILQAGRAAYAKTGFLGFQVLIGEWFRRQNPGWRGNLFVLSRIGLQKRWDVRYLPLSDGATRRRAAEYSVFCTVQGGVPKGKVRVCSIFMQFTTRFMQNGNRKWIGSQNQYTGFYCGPVFPRPAFSLRVKSASSLSSAWKGSYGFK